MSNTKGAYAYSLNGENYLGSYDSRQKALAVGLEMAQKAADPPQTVYVGQRLLADPQAAGHSDDVLARMRERALAEVGGDGEQYLLRVNDQEAADLDAALEVAILAWLAKHELMPTRFNIDAISEHPVPLPSAWSYRGDGSEVHELGVAETLSPEN